MKLTLFWRFVIETEWLHFAFDANDRSWVACICLIGWESGAWRRHVEKISHTTYILPSAVTSAATAVQPAELRVSRGSMQTPSRRWGKTIISTMYLEWNENESFSNHSHAIELITWFFLLQTLFFLFSPSDWHNLLWWYMVVWLVVLGLCHCTAFCAPTPSKSPTWLCKSWRHKSSKCASLFRIPGLTITTWYCPRAID